MFRKSLLIGLQAVAVLTLCCIAGCSHWQGGGESKAHAQAVDVTVDWNNVVRVSNTNATLQVVVSPLMSRTSPIHNQVFQSLHDLGSDYVRYQGWLTYPKLVVAELEPPANGKTSWDFSLLDPLAEDFAKATEGHSSIWDLSTIPQWMFKTTKPVPYPADPNEITWKYEQGTELRDPSMKELGDYYARLASWYTQGGLTDEYGKKHESRHHFTIPYWEVLNEPDLEHFTTPEQYTIRYDAIVSAVQKVSPQTKFVGLALAETSPNVAGFDIPRFFEYFLNHKNHRPGIPLDMISYHAYAETPPEEDQSAAPFSYFDQADQFLREVRYIEYIRKRLSPETRTTVDEFGSILASEFGQMAPGYVFKPIYASYWNLSAALYAYTYGELASLGIDALGESALSQFPGFFPSVSILDWKTGAPNARYWALKLIHDHFGPGDKLVATAVTANVPVYAQAFLTRDGRHKLLLVNKRERPSGISLRGLSAGSEEFLDETTGSGPPSTAQINNGSLTIGGLGVAVIIAEP